MDWYDKQGKLLVTANLGTPEWDEQMQKVEALLTKPEYKIVKQEKTPKKKYFVSTVWVGLDQSFSTDPNHTPIIFETMVFDKKQDSHAQVRYATEEQAMKGHNKLVAEFTKKEK